MTDLIRSGAWCKCGHCGFVGFVYGVIGLIISHPHCPKCGMNDKLSLIPKERK